MANKLACPFCGYEGSKNEFPDWVDADSEIREIKQQARLLKEMTETTPFNIVTCPDCECVFIVKE